MTRPGPTCHYSISFSVGSASEEYPLTVGGFTGVGGDWFAYHNKMKFSTPDNRGVARGGLKGSDEPPFQTKKFLNIASQA